jgi:hypothetical protein
MSALSGNLTAISRIHYEQYYKVFMRLPCLLCAILLDLVFVEQFEVSTFPYTRFEYQEYS